MDFLGRGKKMIECCDHLCHKFKSKSDMCRYWGILPCVFSYRKSKGWSIKKCLTVKSTATPSKKKTTTPSKKKTATPSKKKTATSRKKKYDFNAPTETLFKIIDGVVYDHKGNCFSNLSEMLKVYGVSEAQFYDRFFIKKWDLERSLFCEEIKRN